MVMESLFSRNPRNYFSCVGTNTDSGTGAFRANFNTFKIFADNFLRLKYLGSKFWDGSH